MTITTEAQRALDRNDQSADNLFGQYFSANFGRASRRESANFIGRYRLEDGTELLLSRTKTGFLLRMPEEPT